jgi:hypothetical protein
VSVYKPDGIAGAGSWDENVRHQTYNEVTKVLRRRTVQERPATVGNSPVSETYAPFVLYPK